MTESLDERATAAVDRLVSVAECERLMYEYASRLDRGAGHTVAELFTEDGRWSSPAVSSTGRADLAAYFARRDAMTERVTRHVVTNIDITLRDADTAVGRSVAIEYRGERDDAADEVATDTSPAIVGDYEDEFRRVDGTWLFHRRHVEVAFKRAGEQYLRPVPKR